MGSQPNGGVFERGGPAGPAAVMTLRRRRRLRVAVAAAAVLVVVCTGAFLNMDSWARPASVRRWWPEEWLRVAMYRQLAAAAVVEHAPAWALPERHPWHRVYWMIWTTPATTFKLRHRFTLDSVRPATWPRPRGVCVADARPTRRCS